MALALVIAMLPLIAVTAPAASANEIVSGGPLDRIETTPDLNCAVDHVDDAAGEFFFDTACATLVVVDGVLYGPADIPAGGSAAPRTPFEPVSQTGPIGAGTPGDPFEIVTEVDAGGGVSLTQTDTYLVGQESYRTDVMVHNANPAPTDVRVYRAGDCFLQDSDSGFGLVDAATGAVSCQGELPGSSPPEPGPRIEQWFPLTPGSHYYEAGFSEVWAEIGAQSQFPDTCRCDENIDNGAGLSWDASVPAGASTTISSIITFSPLGVLPLTTSKVADDAESAPGATNGYTITIENPNDTSVTLDEMNDTLPAGFAYVPGSTSGVTTDDPTILGQTLTWGGPFEVAATGSVELSFAVNVSDTAGTYVNSAGAAAEAGFTVIPAEDTAPIDVVGGPVSEIVLGPEDATNVVGDDHTVTATVTSDGAPVEGADVAFTVLSGPNAGDAGTDATAVDGAASFTYTGDGGEGTDEIQASAEIDGEPIVSNTVTKTWVSPSEADHVEVVVQRLPGWGVAYENAGFLTSGDLSIAPLLSGAVSRIVVDGTIPGVDGGEATIRMNMRRPISFLQFYVGHVSVDDPSANGGEGFAISLSVFDGIHRLPPGNAARGTLYGIRGPFPPMAYRVPFTVVDNVQLGG